MWCRAYFACLAYPLELLGLWHILETLSPLITAISLGTGVLGLVMNFVSAPLAGLSILLLRIL